MSNGQLGLVSMYGNLLVAVSNGIRINNKVNQYRIAGNILESS